MCENAKLNIGNRREPLTSAFSIYVHVHFGLRFYTKHSLIPLSQYEDLLLFLV